MNADERPLGEMPDAALGAVELQAIKARISVMMLTRLDDLVTQLDCLTTDRSALYQITDALRAKYGAPTDMTALHLSAGRPDRGSGIPL